ncbi:MAG: hypothetical protein PHD01_14635 [Geobacteraceae bacterium]|nr:hypothetical protein [Geobacteraceae bacterium]
MRNENLTLNLDFSFSSFSLRSLCLHAEALQRQGGASSEAGERNRFSAFQLFGVTVFATNIIVTHLTVAAILTIVYNLSLHGKKAYCTRM